MATRRAVLAGAATAVLSTAGCSELYGGPDDPERDGDVEDADDGGEMAVHQMDGPAEATLLSIAEVEGDGKWPLVAYGHVDEVATVDGRDDHHWADVAFTDDGWAAFHDGFADAKVFENHEEFRMRTHVDDEVVFTGELNEDLVTAVEEGEWAGTLRVSTETREQAEAIAETVEEL